MESPPEDARALLCWTSSAEPEARRGHAYLYVDGDAARWELAEHRGDRGGVEHARMMRRYQGWQSAHPPTPEEALRRRTIWRDPSGAWTFFGDLGAVRAGLLGREVELRLGAEVGPLAPLPTDFLRRPVSSLVEAVAGPVRWPAELEAEHVCVGLRGPLAARRGGEIIVCAARYGSIHAASGQDRTAAIWRSETGAEGWTELPWTLAPTLRQRASGVHRSCWPPEQVDRIELGAAGEITVDWVDPWIDWEPGTEWRGRWDPGQARWTMASRT